LTAKIAEKDATVPELPVKDLVRLVNKKDPACPHVVNQFCAGIPHTPRHPVQQKPTSIQGMFSPARLDPLPPNHPCQGQVVQVM
jgi:hypothetical protein